MKSQCYYCYFCNEKIIKLTGTDSDSLCVHHLNGNHNDDRPANRVNAHNGCHIRYHKRGVHRSEETKQLLRIANLGKHHSEETKQTLRLAKIGKHNSIASKQKVRNYRLRVCRICGFELQDDLATTLALEHDQRAKHYRTMKQHLKKCHPDVISQKVFWKFSDYFMSKTDADNLKLLLTQSH
jgi:hypothetical protein